MPKPNHGGAADGGDSIGSEKPCNRSYCHRTGAQSLQGASASSLGGIRHKARREDLEKGSRTVTVVYHVNTEIEDEYWLFLENVCVYENEDFLVEYEGKVIRYGGGEVVDDDGNLENPAKEEEEKKVVVSLDEPSDDSMMSFMELDPLDNSTPRQKAQKVTEDKENMDEEDEHVVSIKGKGAYKCGENGIGK
uniref:Uncharacterized protein n=1 Tax=Leersia perrieri TaxID=77586 RepID=A0A0D9W285_9ORYZ